MDFENISDFTNGSANSEFENETWASGSTFPIQFSFFAPTMALIGLFGNIIVLVVIFGIPSNRKPANYLLGNLSVASLIFISVMTMKALERSGFHLLPISKLTCHFHVFYTRLSIPIVALTTMAISLDRSRVAMSPPVMSPSGKSIIYRISLVWTSSVLITLPRIFMISFNPNAENHYCVKELLLNNKIIHMTYLIFHLMAIHIAPACILIMETIRMSSKIKFLLCKAKVDRGGEIQPYRGLAEKRLRLVRNACIFTSIFFICWLPFGIFLFPNDLGPEFLSKEARMFLNNSLSNGVFITGYTLVCITPFVLFIISHNFRANIFLCSHCCYDSMAMK